MPSSAVCLQPSKAAGEGSCCVTQHGSAPRRREAEVRASVSSLGTPMLASCHRIVGGRVHIMRISDVANRPAAAEFSE